MKRGIYCILGLIGMVALFFCGFFSYSYFYPQQYEKDESGEYINVNAPQNATFPITEQTHFIIESVYPKENKTITESIDSIPALLGYDLEETKNYLSGYMQHLSTKEQMDGLIAYELISYEGNLIRFRKTYQKNDSSGFVAKSFNGMVVILNNDEKTVYEYTEININNLPEELQDLIAEGWYLETEEELYGFLENYSS